MEEIEHYRNLVRQILTDHADATIETIQPQQIFDTTHDHYQLNYVGWQGKRRVFGPILHLNIQNGKVWIQYNRTEDSIAERLVELGVPRSDIVIGFHSPFKRQFSGYAVE
ncbi:MAG: XisI protein [Plectolyngbya sp. WJT66-NPBG17]|jgi:hypothetical protein|nr:XisI protein [Plectolyngbya sp. WJT66-NPBG17]MBW4525233.1 XisI protein [Phormidium tanganyikae FI6-MK23]